MVTKLFAVLDTKVEAFQAPMSFRTRGQAIRAFQEACSDNNTQFCKHPDDFVLFEIGEYDEGNGVITPYEAKVPIGTPRELMGGRDNTRVPSPVPKSVN